MNIQEWLLQLGTVPTIMQSRLLYSVTALIVLYIIRWVSIILLHRFNRDVRQNYYLRSVINWLFFVVLLFVLGWLWIENIQSFATFFGLLSAGLAIALKDPIDNLAAWFFIVLNKPFQVGNRIQIGEHAGDVIDIGLFQFTINEIGNWVDADQSTGRIIHIPNAKVFSESQANYNRGFKYIWNEIGVLVTFESDWKKAKEILVNVATHYTAVVLPEDVEFEMKQQLNKAAQRHMLFYRILTPKVYTTVKDSGVMLSMRYLCQPQKRRDSEEIIWEHILEDFAKHEDIDFAYPSIRYYDNVKEGKEGTKPK